MLRRIASYLMLLACLGAPTARAGDYAASFLNIGVGARGLGMGGALVSLADDVNAFFWNPAGVGYVKGQQLSGMYGPQFGSFQNPLATFHHVGAAKELSRGAVLAVNWVRLAVEDIPVYSELRGDSFWDRFHDPALRPSGEPESYMADVEDAVLITFAKNNKKVWNLGWDFHKIDVEIPMGVTLKWFRQRIGDQSASGMGIDAGMMLRFSLGQFFDSNRMGRVALGLKIQDIVGSKMTWDSKHQDAIPANFHYGASYTQPLAWQSSSLTFAWGHETRWRRGSHYGMEWKGMGFLALRVGLDDGQMTAGAGFKIWKIKADYAFLSHELDALHRISCLIQL